jgi:hypothetical protein
MSLDESIPRANWPETPGIYKVVQLYIADEVYLRFGKRPEPPYDDGDYHEFILEKFADEIGVEYRKVPRSPNQKTMIAVLPDDDKYGMPGAELCDINLEDRTANFYGDSFDYKKGIDPDHLEKFKQLFPDWQMKLFA